MSHTRSKRMITYLFLNILQDKYESVKYNRLGVNSSRVSLSIYGACQTEQIILVWVYNKIQLKKTNTIETIPHLVGQKINSQKKKKILEYHWQASPHIHT